MPFNKARYFDTRERDIAKNDRLDYKYSQKRVNAAKAHMANAKKAIYKSPLRQHAFTKLKRAWKEKRNDRHIKALHAAENKAYWDAMHTKRAIKKFSTGKINTDKYKKYESFYHY